VNVYWYWPFLRREELGQAEGVVGPGDRLFLHTTPRPTDPIVSPEPAWQVDATLPAVDERAEGSITWAASRGLTYLDRARVRARTARTGGFDVCHVVYLNPFTDPFTLGALQKHVPLVTSVHDVVPHNARVPAAVEHALLAREYRHGGTLLVHHASVGRRLTDEFDVDPGRIVVVPLQIPPPEIRRPEHPPARREGTKTVLFFGAFRRNKGIDVLLEAIRRLRGESDARFVFAGRGFPDVEQQVAEAAARDPRIDAEIGYATAARKSELHATADLMVLPYTSFASQSAVLQDAYAHRLPVVVSDVGALGETIREDRTGWVVEPGDPERLAATILAALRDEDALARAAAAANVIALDRTPVRIGRRWREVYEQVIAADPHP
jgi:glycosyltransferase involved in cell wall biosynthesis